MIKETDGEKYEEVRSLNQELTFREAEQFFGAQNVPFDSNQHKTLRLLTPDGVYTKNIAIIP